MVNNAAPVLVVAAVIRQSFGDDSKVLIVRRGPAQSGAGYWEFPGGKVEPGEPPEQALVREIDEELGVPIRVGELIGELDFAYPSKTIRLRVYWAETHQTELHLTEHDDFRWCHPYEINVGELSEADRPFVEMIIQGSR
jgi:mutator protein MutT